MLFRSSSTSKLLLLRDGVAQLFGPRDQVLAELAKATQQRAQPAQQPPAAQPPADTQARIEATNAEAANTPEQE